MWHFVAISAGRHSTSETRCEILVSLLGLHLAFTDMRSPINDEVVSSNAPMKGCLSEKGVQALKDGDTAEFRPFGTIASTTEANARPRVDYLPPRAFARGPL